MKFTNLTIIILTIVYYAYSTLIRNFKNSKQVESLIQDVFNGVLNINTQDPSNTSSQSSQIESSTKSFLDMGLEAALNNNPYTSLGLLAVDIISKNMKEMKAERERFNKEFIEQQNNIKKDMKEFLNLNRKEAFNQMLNSMDLSDSDQITDETMIPLIKSFLEKNNSKGVSNYIENGNWLGLGYNIIIGNQNIPSSSGQTVDDGIASRIFLLEDENKETYDGYYKVPKGFEIQAAQICQSNIYSEIIRTSSQLSNMSSQTNSLEISMPFISGAGNDELVRMKNTMNTEGKAYVKTEATCSIYRSVVDIYNPPKLSINFIKGLYTLYKNPYKLEFSNKIDINRNIIDVYEKFISTFGTHFIYSLQMGSKFTFIEEISKSDLSDLESNGYSIGALLQMKKLLGGDKIEGNSSSSLDELNKYSKKVTRRYVTSLGAPLPPDMKMERWFIMSKYKPQPISYQIETYDFLLSNSEIVKQVNKHYPEIDLKIVKDSLKSYLSKDSYCNILKSIYNIGCWEYTSFKTEEVYKKYSIHFDDSNSIHSLNNVEIKCDSNQGLFSFVMNEENYKLRFVYECVTSQLISNKCAKFSYTKAINNLDSNGIKNLPSFPIDCPSQSVINSFNWKVDNDKKNVLFDYECCPTSFDKTNSEEELWEKIWLNKSIPSISNLKNIKVRADNIIQNKLLNEVKFNFIDDPKYAHIIIKFKTVELKLNK